MIGVAAIFVVKQTYTLLLMYFVLYPNCSDNAECE